MKNKVWNTFILLLALYAIGSQVVHAQGLASGMYAVSPSFTLANCETGAIAGYTMFCPIGTGQYYYCLSTTTTCGTSTAGWVLIGTAAAPQLTINGVQKSLPASFTIATSSTATVPAASFASNGALTLSAPSVTSTTTAQ